MSCILELGMLSHVLVVIDFPSLFLGSNRTHILKGPSHGC